MTIVGISFLLLSYGLFLFFTHWEAQFYKRILNCPKSVTIDLNHLDYFKVEGVQYVCITKMLQVYLDTYNV